MFELALSLSWVHREKKIPDFPVKRTADGMGNKILNGEPPFRCANIETVSVMFRVEYHPVVLARMDQNLNSH
jgi:hypothetical protein